VNYNENTLFKQWPIKEMLTGKTAKRRVFYGFMLIKGRSEPAPRFKPSSGRIILIDKIRTM
jgi:hypothetical protein